MPCNTITTTELDFKNADALVFKQMLKDLGMNITVDTATKLVARKGNTTISWEKGIGTKVQSDTNIAETIKQKYSAAAIAWAAKKNGWLVNQKSENKFEVVRRY